MTNPDPDNKNLQLGTSEAVDSADIPASIDYRLRSRAVIREYQNGSIYKSQICDAHSELLRAAEGVGKPLNTPCPVCSELELVHVSYLFGARMGPGGRCVANTEELLNVLKTKKGLFTCYVVEVCLGCTWNFLSHSFPIYMS